MVRTSLIRIGTRKVEGSVFMSSTIEIDEIMKVLPHRYPMLLVDRIIETDDNTKIIGIKCVSANEPFFEGHFPNLPIMPGVLQIEAMAQTGGILLLKRYGKSNVTPYLMAVDKARFRRAVCPGDVLRIEISILNLRENVVKFQGRILVDGAIASEAEITCMIGDRNKNI